MHRVTSRFNNLYASGVSNSSTTTPAPQIIAQSANYNSSATAVNPRTDNPTKYSRQVISVSNNSFTDAPGTYVTDNATASARIHISN